MNELMHSPNLSNISSLSPLSSISNSSETNNNIMLNSKQFNKPNSNMNDQRQFKNDWNTTFNGQQKNPSNVENEQDFEKVLDLKQQDIRQNLANNSNKKPKLDSKQETENGLLQSFLASSQNLNNDISMSLQFNQMQQLNWLLNQKNSIQTNKLNQNNTNTALLSGHFNPNENFNCLNSFFNSNLMSQPPSTQSMPNSSNFQMNLNTYQMNKNSFGLNPFSMTSQAANVERASENAAILPNQVEMTFSPKKILELLSYFNLMSTNNGNNSMNLNAATAAAFFNNQIKSGESNAANLNSIENLTVQQLNLLSSMSNAAGL